MNKSRNKSDKCWQIQNSNKVLWMNKSNKFDTWKTLYFSYNQNNSRIITRSSSQNKGWTVIKWIECNQNVWSSLNFFKFFARHIFVLKLAVFCLIETNCVYVCTLHSELTLNNVLLNERICCTTAFHIAILPLLLHCKCIILLASWWP